MKITIAIYPDKGISRFIYVNELNREWDMESKEFEVSPYKNKDFWILDFRPYDMEQLELDIDCELTELSEDYLIEKYPELLL